MLGEVEGRSYYKFLISIMLVELLGDCTQIAPNMVLTLRAKVCRRMAKLEHEKHNFLLEATRSYFKDIILPVTSSVESAWERYKLAIKRKIPVLDLRVDAAALRLSLPNSGPHLEGILALRKVQNQPTVSLPLPNISTIQHAEAFFSKYFALAELEESIGALEILPNPQGKNCEQLCQAIDNIFETVGTAYHQNPEQMSIFILSLFELWVQLDREAVLLCPLLSEYRVPFLPELLNVLQLPTASRLRQLRVIQNYLRQRNGSGHSSKTIFSEPSDSSFGVKYASQTSSMCTLLEDIQVASAASRERKIMELEKWWKEYDKHSDGIESTTCSCSFKYGQKDIRGCTRCWHWRVRNRMKIEAHEDLLPSQPFLARSVIFELRIPKYLCRYRDATFRILKLAYPSLARSEAPPVRLLQDYGPLSIYASSSMGGVSLASTSKPFLGTHYRVQKTKMRATMKDVLYLNGLNFRKGLFDQGSKTWLADMTKDLTFEHLCGVHVPKGLRDTVIPGERHPPTEIQWPTSYEIAASKTRCPESLSLDEFLAYQRLLSSKSLRWPTILMELGSSNINLNSEDTMLMVNHLVNQAGDAQHSHAAFLENEIFCSRLKEQIRNRLENMAGNWREIYCMEILITLLLRLFNTESCKDEAEDLLKQARQTTLQWLVILRTDVRKAGDADHAKSFAHYAFFAALLCRRTFTLFCDMDVQIPPEDLITYFEATLGVQENLLVDLERLSNILTIMLVRDTKMCYRLSHSLLISLRAAPYSLGKALNSYLTGSKDSTEKRFTEWNLMTPGGHWLQSMMRSPDSAWSQVIHVNYIEGHLLIDGKPFGRLPRNIRESEDVKRLFGLNAHLLTYPSSESGMSFVMAQRVEGNEVHFGMRKDRVVIRARCRNNLLEYIAPHHFYSEGSYDLPIRLIFDAAHWLNLSTKVLEVRQMMFYTKSSDFKIDLRSREAIRNNRSLLVDPHSDISQQIAGIFRYFEAPERITIYQPIGGVLHVELKHLGLSFKVNPQGWLHCKELGEEIDPNQDCGTLYGLESKLVLRNPAQTDTRSIICPFGDLTVHRRGMHVGVFSEPGATEYARFEIDDTVGRLTCNPEPRIMYTKAQLHAFTSFVLPDPLTSRTGTQEAVRILQSGACQPWTPLGAAPLRVLECISKLSPDRIYYAGSRKSLQTVQWDENAASIQHDIFIRLVNEIITKSERLRLFHISKKSNEELSEDSPRTLLPHLQRRGLHQRCLYERGLLQENVRIDRLYQSRGRNKPMVDAYRIAKLFQAQPFSINLNRHLIDILQGWAQIGGFSAQMQPGFPASLGSIVELNIEEQWGQMVNICQRACPEDQYRLTFYFSLMSLNQKTTWDIIQVLVSFVVFPELKSLIDPDCPSINHFKLNEQPTTESLLRIISVDLPEKPPRYAPPSQVEHYNTCVDEAKQLSSHCVSQWPDGMDEISLRGFRSSVLDLGQASERISGEWCRLRNNSRFSVWVSEIEEILGQIKMEGSRDAEPACWDLGDSARFDAQNVVPPISQLLSTSLESPLKIEYPTIVRISDAVKGAGEKVSTNHPKAELTELESLLSKFVSSTESRIRRQYGSDLQASLKALKRASSDEEMSCFVPTITSLTNNIQKLRSIMKVYFSLLRNTFSEKDDCFQWLNICGLWPLQTSTDLLECIGSKASVHLGHNVLDTIVNFGVFITCLQQHLRIRRFVRQQNHTRSQDELGNRGHQNWNATEYPDWLLLEIDADLLIREEQVVVADAMIDPQSRENTVLQLNMGKGKTSVIVPAVMAIVSNGNRLGRLVVPKPLILATAQLLQARLGGLVGRAVQHIPFHRRTNMNSDLLTEFISLHREIYEAQGVMLATPESLLSFQLSGSEALTKGDLKMAKAAIGFQTWLESNSRDVLDESDVSLAVKTSLIYPTGELAPIDGGSLRWNVAEALLGLVLEALPALQRKFPTQIQIIHRHQGSFPIIHILKAEVEGEIHRHLSQMISSGKTSILQFDSQENEKGVMEFLMGDSPDDSLLRIVSRFPQANETETRNTLLLVRGLFQHSILIVCLKRRWNVQYGLHPEREPIAVPFEAKSTPSTNAEFGHPDVAIILTVLAFYYTGLTLMQFEKSLKNVLSSNDPQLDYARWVSGVALPESLSHWNTINIEDQNQISELWNHLRMSRAVLDHYMNNYVFPIHAKQFAAKLQASGWDIPLLCQNETREARSTGFSGTNDNKSLLPLNIRQHDLPELHGTNAEVLGYLLLKRNRGYSLAAENGARLSETGFLRMLHKKSIRVLIDAGACIMEMNNQNLVQEWMKIDTAAQAGIYFAADGRAMVKFRSKKGDMPLTASPFNENLDNCLVYFAEAQTRGIDLKLPIEARGALTLSLSQTKDQTVQGKFFHVTM